MQKHQHPMWWLERRFHAVDELRVEQLRELIQEKSFNVGGDFALSSGKASDCFFDLKPVMMDPEGIHLLTDIFLRRIADEETDYIGGVAVGAVPIVSAICAMSFYGAHPRKGFFVRKEWKQHGMRKRIEGNPPDKGSEALLFEDVTTTGESAMVAVGALRGIGCRVNTLYTIVDRSEGAEVLLAKAGIQLVPLFTKDDFTEA